MIFGCVALALFQLWPVVFGHKPNAEVAASMSAPRLVPAVAVMSKAPVPAVSRQMGPPQSCYAHYRAAYTGCATGDRACHLRAADAWDLCEATGTWGK
ncbi:hypothetical protein QH494_02980 [Sphingomonas sp. AR_OL41]|nr:hypothetical protein [Sphingomonas sp. AR_OL41]